MSNGEETFVNPDGASSGASQLTSAADNLARRFKQLSGTIDGMNTGKPWGDDEPGKTFFKEYLESGAESSAAVTLDAGHKLVETMAELGPGVKSAVEGTVEVDDLFKKWFDGGKK